ncbi:hypothetical protein CBR_g3563 [Chara braunii]|uniref:Chloride channel protein n=1 Tax=Chara braunii TaxID=69332 RepID=A0A388KFS3_CHABU|nr:hypothetical protein CBR_g3563 [Chara braunii]|eukprot:GBG68866.1 hypothetical protein CBR_g3563 [Chara braunii]
MKLCNDGICGHFGSGGFIIWNITGWQDDYLFFELLPMAMLGVMGGLLGAMFNQLTWYVTSWRRCYLHKKGDRVKVIEALLISLLTSVLSFCLPLMKQCTPCPEGAAHCPRPSLDYDNFVDFHCSASNEYNDLGTIFFNTQDDAIRNLFSSKTQHEYSSETLLIFFVVFYLLAVVTYGINVPSGQFVPGILLGATYGRLIGMLMVKMYNIDEGTYVCQLMQSFAVLAIPFLQPSSYW